MSDISRRRRMKPEEMAKHYIIQSVDQDGLKEKLINNYIGRGVFASKPYNQGDFLLQYCGILHKNITDLVDTNFTYHFTYKGNNYCIDATNEPIDGPKLGRLVNHADVPKERNSTMKIVEVAGNPYLCLFSTRYIQEEEEIRYDYGVKDLPWKVAKYQRENLQSTDPILITNTEKEANEKDKEKGKENEDEKDEEKIKIMDLDILKIHGYTNPSDLEEIAEDNDRNSNNSEAAYEADTTSN